MISAKAQSAIARVRALSPEARSKALAEAFALKAIRAERERQSDLGSPGRLGGLIHFVRYFWRILEPNTPFVDGWVLHAMCMHLEAVTRGEIKRLLINVPPGFAKSMLVNVFFPLWEWSAAGQPWHRYVTFAYASHLTERDNRRFLDLAQSPEFRVMWGHVVQLTSNGVTKPTNAAKGWKFSSSIDGVGTGERGSRVLCDDVHNIREGESETIRSGTVRWVKEGMSNRLNDMQNDVIIGVGQRVHENDASDAMISSGDYDLLMVQMEYDPAFHCSTSIGWEDPRTEFGELAWPERFPQNVVSQIKRTMGPYAWASQYMQTPEPRGGGIIKRDWWGKYDLPIGSPFPHKFEYVVASLDGAYTAKEENDPSGFTIWGVYFVKGNPKIVLLHAWKKWLVIHGQTVKRLPGEDNRTYVRRAAPNWGLVEWIVHDCTRLGVHKLLIEDKASGHSVAQEVARLFQNRAGYVQLVNPGRLDKRARILAVQHLFADGMIEAPVSTEGDFQVYREWAQMVIDEVSKYRGLAGDSDNLVDSTSQALTHLRDLRLAMRRDEVEALEEEMARHKPVARPLYPA